MERATTEDLMAIAKQMAGTAGLLDQTSRPNEPVTAGLLSGPGPGPEVLQMRTGSPGRRVLEDLTRWTGDPYFARLAEGI